MKTLLFFLFFILNISLVAAMYGGESYIKDFEYCNNITVIIKANNNIDIEEFILNEECLEIGNYTYNCNCSDGWTFNLTTKINTINTYNITFNFDYEKEVASSSGSSSGGGSGSSRRQVIENITEDCNRTNWNCTVWRDSVSGKVRDCYDNCGNYLLDTKSNPMVYTQPEVIESGLGGLNTIENITHIIVDEEENNEKDSVLGYLIIIIFFVMIIGLIIGLIYFFKK